MALIHSVKQGEHMSGIARHYGFSDYKKLWDHANNAKLKTLRKNPNILLPGDEVFVPDREVGRSSAPPQEAQLKSRTIPCCESCSTGFTTSPTPIRNAFSEIQTNRVDKVSDGAGKIEHGYPTTVGSSVVTVKDQLLRA